MRDQKKVSTNDREQTFKNDNKFHRKNDETSLQVSWSKTVYQNNAKRIKIVTQSGHPKQTIVAKMDVQNVVEAKIEQI